MSRKRPARDDGLETITLLAIAMALAIAVNIEVGVVLHHRPTDLVIIGARAPAAEPIPPFVQ